jgi:20S proteasome alpha/beta subunit
MTLIIGVRGKDGVSLGSDRKVLRGGEAEFSNKIFIINNVALAVEGLTGIRDDFLYLLDIELKRRRGVDTLYEMKVIAEDIIADLTERYKERITEESTIGVLMAGRENLTYGKALLYYIHGVGYGEAVDFLCTGHGGPYATSLAKFLLKKDLDAIENGKRIAFVISWVAEDVDVTVGGDPDVVIVHDSDKPTENPIENLSRNLVDNMKERSKKAKENLLSILGLENKS